jgi:hypothetical protein
VAPPPVINPTQTSGPDGGVNGSDGGITETLDLSMHQGGGDLAGVNVGPDMVSSSTDMAGACTNKTYMGAGGTSCGMTAFCGGFNYTLNCTQATCNCNGANINHNYQAQVSLVCATQQSMDSYWTGTCLFQ